jgi:hypothetical protein
MRCSGYLRFIPLKGKRENFALASKWFCHNIFWTHKYAWGLKGQ